jgi:hypothetical protein
MKIRGTRWHLVPHSEPALEGSDLALYYWAKVIEADFVIEDQQLVALAAAHRQAQANGYKLAGGQ